MTQQASAKDILYGLALGDATGWPTEFLKLHEIKSVYGRNGILEPPDPALITDDTQMTLAIAQALVKLPNSTIDELMIEVSKQFVKWLNSPDNNRAPGTTCVPAVRRLEDGISWKRSGNQDSLGCGSAMRVAPIGFLYQLDPIRLREVSHATGIATHRNATADASAIAGAYMIKLALDGVAPLDMIEETIRFLNGTSPTFDDKLRQVAEVIEWQDEEQAMDFIGEGWRGHEAVSLALYCVARYPDSWTKTIWRAANSSGDSDSIACIAGGIQAARLGGGAIPTEWIERLERKEEMEELGELLDQLKLKRN